MKRSRANAENIIREIYLTNFEMSGKIATKYDVLVSRPMVDVRNGEAEIYNLDDLLGVVGRMNFS